LADSATKSLTSSSNCTSATVSSLKSSSSDPEIRNDSNSNNDVRQLVINHTAAHADELSILRQLVFDQHLEIKRLHEQLNFVLSFLGITDMVKETGNDSDETAAIDDMSPESRNRSNDHHSNDDASHQASWS
jgi:hypothetical protein